MDDLLEPGNGSATTVTVSSAASMNNVNDAAEVLRQRQRFETCAFYSDWNPGIFGFQEFEENFHFFGILQTKFCIPRTFLGFVFIIHGNSGYISWKLK